MDSDCLAGWNTEVSSTPAGEGLDNQKLESRDLQRWIK